MANDFPLNALGLSHQFMAAHVREGAFFHPLADTFIFFLTSKNLLRLLRL